VPVIGNGDIFSWRDAVARLEQSGCAAVMVGRWALAKPWIFQEYNERRDIELNSDARIEVVRRYVELCREQFGDDERGRRRIRRFLVFHQDFFRRYRRGGRLDGVNSEDPRDWGQTPADELESWLCRGDVAAADALCRWLVDGEEAQPPGPPGTDTRRAVNVEATG
jgi:tRNA-dihydrouridine synthase 3